MKYVISENHARAIREFAMSYLVHDEHALGKPNYQYPVYSLYLDSDDLVLCRATINGDKNRVKLRIRVYDDKATSPAFFEIKRRMDTIIVKQRVAVQRQSIPRLLGGHWPERDDMVSFNPTGFGILQRWCELRNIFQAKGWAFVCYNREAYVPPDNDAVRMTFDRDLVSWRYRNKFSLADRDSQVYPQVDGVILEVKFTDRFPTWVRQMVRIFDLTRVPFPKYVLCVKTLTGKVPPRRARTLEIEA